MLGFYGNLFIAQEKSAPQVAPIVIPDDLLSAKRKEGLPLIDKTEFRLDRAAARDLLLTLCDIAALPESGLPVDVGPLKEAVLSKAIDPERLFPALLRDDPAPVAGAAETAGVEQPLLEFLIYNSIKPSLTACRDLLIIYLDPNLRWDNGYCPVCGGLPVLSSLSAEKGRRHLFCAVCWHDWSFPRMRCPHCGRDAPKVHPYLHTEEEPEYRVDLCDHCRSYLKTVDVRRLDRPFHPPLEALVTLHLDMSAQTEGYESGIVLDIDS
jgi:FdhE protein